jgi:hypothetical protein
MGEIGLYVIGVRGNASNGIDDLRVLAVAHDDRAHGAGGDGIVNLAIYGSDGDLLNDVTGESEQSRADAQSLGLDAGYERVQIGGGEGRLPVPEGGTYELRWGDETIAEFGREELFNERLDPVGYGATDRLALEIAVDAYELAAGLEARIAALESEVEDDGDTLDAPAPRRSRDAPTDEARERDADAGGIDWALIGSIGGRFLSALRGR